MSFPLKRLTDIQQAPDEFKLLELMPAMKWQLPVTLNAPTGETYRCVVIDCETTGLDAQECDIIEFGFVVCTVDVTTGNICTVERMGSYFNEPSVPIEPVITEITGITNEDVAGHHLSMDLILDALSAADLCIAHNAKFDRSFVDSHVTKLGFPALTILWACSIKDVDWRTLGCESNALGYLLFKKGYFFSGHRAWVDCLATVYMLHIEPMAMQRIITAFTTPTYDLRVTSRFQAKDRLKDLDCQWDAGAKQWHKIMTGSEEEITAEIEQLKTADVPGAVHVQLESISPLMRYAASE